MSSSYISNKKSSELSEPQKMIYLSELLYPGNCLNTVVTVSALLKHSNIDVLIKVLNEVIQENPGLHIKIDKTKGSPVQYIDNNGDYEIEIIDFRNDNSKKESIWLNSEVNRHFTLEKSNLFKFVIYIRHNGSLNLLLSMHHIICDAWSHQSLAKQVYEKYENIINNNFVAPTTKFSYMDYVDIEKKYIDSPRFKLSRNYWISKFYKYNEIPSFIKKLDKNVNTTAKQFHADFDDSIQKNILKICEENKISFSTFFLSCLIISLCKLKKDKKILLGTLSYNRLGKKEKSAIGMFVNTLPLIFDLEELNTYEEIVKYVDVEMAGLMKNQRFPLRLITNDIDIKKLNIADNLNIIYSYQNIILPYEYNYEFSGHSVHPILFRPTRRGENGGFFLDIDYKVGCFSEEEINNISEVYIDVIKNFNADLGKSVTLNESVSEVKNDMDKFIYSQNHNLEQTLHRVFEKRADQYSEKKAISFSGKYLTYYELNRRANYLASMLLEKGAGNETPVVLLLDRSLEMMISILAVLKTGSCYLPLSPDLPISRTNKILDLSGSTIVLYNTDLNKEMSKDLFSLDVNSINFPQADIPNLHIDIKPENLAYIIYTSGSTGEPKGVMIEHKSVINRLLWMQEKYPLTESDIVMQKTPYTFDVSVWELFGWYLNGSVLHFLAPGAEKEPATIAEEIQREKISIIHFVPSMLTLFLEYIDKYGSTKSVDTIRRVSCSGEAILTDHVNKFKKVMNKNRRVELYNLYGPTEATVEVSIFDCLNNKHDFVPIGKPIDNVELYVLDKSGEVLPPGTTGELFIGGVCLARGYFNKPDLTDDKFKINPVLGKRLYSTGDLATYLDDGNIKYIGRIDNQVKIRGNRVELGEIESCLLSFVGIFEAAVIALTDENGSAYLGAYIVAESKIPHKDLRHFIQNELPSYMIPSYFVQMDEFPLSSSGKLDRKALPEPEDRIHQKEKYHAPVNEREEEICEIWEDVLKLEKIGRHDNFFTDLGGDSLSLIQVMFPLQDKYELSLQDLFEFQTIETLSQHIHKRSAKNIEFKKDSFESLVKHFSCMDKIQEYSRSYLDLPVMKEVVYSNLLVTGSTGFLGTYLVKEYLENSETHLHLLIRGNSLADAENRFKAKMTYYFGNDFYDKFSRRISVVNGDLIKNNFGIEPDLYKELSHTIEGVVHSAANVKHYGDRDDIYNINVNGTKNVLSFCNNGLIKKIFFVSTASVGLNSVNPGWIYNFTEFDIAQTDNRGNVYLDSKILAEEAVRADIGRLGGQILRVGNIVNDSETGKFQENRHNNAFYSLMMEYKKRGIAPNIEIPFIDLSFVNETAKAIRVLSMCDRGGTYHLLNPNKITVKEMCNDQNIEHIEFGEFILSLKHGDSLLTHGYYLQNSDLLGLNHLNDFTTHVLGKLGFNWSSIGQDEVNTLWLNWLN